MEKSKIWGWSMIGIWKWNVQLKYVLDSRIHLRKQLRKKIMKSSDWWSSKKYLKALAKQNEVEIR